MKRLTYSFAAKAAASFLFFFAAFTASLCAAAIILNLDLGFYSIPAGNSFDDAILSLELSDTRLYLGLDYRQNLFRYLFSIRHWALGLFVLLAVCLVVLLIYLLCAAGRREGHPGIYLSFFDRIPFDLNICVVGVCYFFGLVMLNELPYLFDYSFLYIDQLFAAVIIIGLILSVALMLMLWLLFTFAARAKAGHWWRCTIIYMTLRLIFKMLRGLGRFLVRAFRIFLTVPGIAVLTAGVLVLQFFLTITIYFSVRDLILLVALDLVILAGIVWSAYQMRKLYTAGEQLASGEVDARVDTSKMYAGFKEHGEHLNSISDGIAVAVEARTRSERMKAELITNVSHDIKTPLTSIVNYVDLLQHSTTEDERDKYLDVLNRQAGRLKKLTEDLVEASKASTGSMQVDMAPVNVGELINQSLAEYAERLEHQRLTAIYNAPGSISVWADGRLLWRVLDNLLSNAVKYAQDGTRLYIDAAPCHNGTARIAVKNISRDILNVSADELMERFVRADPSRTTEGSGLGLNIAKSLVELMGGAFSIHVDGDLFKAELYLPLFDSEVLYDESDKNEAPGTPSAAWSRDAGDTPDAGTGALHQGGRQPKSGSHQRSGYKISSRRAGREKQRGSGLRFRLPWSDVSAGERGSDE